MTLTPYAAGPVSDTAFNTNRGLAVLSLRALRDNLISAAEGGQGAPVVAAGWHPYDLTAVGGSADGTIYDHAVDGAVSIVETPAFEAGYEYAMIVDVTMTNVSALETARYKVESQRDSNSAWYGPAGTGGSWTTDPAIFYLPEYPKLSLWRSDFSTAGTYAKARVRGFIYDSVGETEDGARNFVGGTIRMLRRREYVTA